MQDGFDVWIVSLRGDEGTTPPSRRARRSISFDDYARYDMAAAVDAVRERTGSETVSWVGHSLGGMLLYAWLSQRPETISAGVAAAFLLAISPSAIFFGRFFISDTPIVFYSVAAVFAWVVYLDTRSRAACIAGTICAALAFLVKIPAVMPNKLVRFSPNFS